MMKKLLTVLVMLTGSSPLYCQYYTYPFFEPVHSLREMRTAHFRIIFSEGTRKEAELTASFAEEEYQSLGQIYGPLKNIGAPVRVVLSGDYQLANGFANPAGIPAIHLYVGAPPSSSSTIANLGPDSLRAMFRHELTHIFTLSLKAKGSPRFDYLMGNIIHPNTIFASGLLIEGAPVVHESDQGRGRINDPYTYHLLRRDLYGGGKLRSPARVSGADGSFDAGHLPYTYGGLFYDYLLQSFTTGFDLRIWETLSRWKTSAYAVPLAVIDDPRQVPRTYASLWREFEGHQRGLLSALENPQTLLPPAKRRIHSLTLRGENIYYYESRSRRLRRLHLPSGEDSLVLYGSSSWEKVHISPDEKLALVSGTFLRRGIARVFTALIRLDTGLPLGSPMEGLTDASFAPYASLANPAFTAVRITFNRENGQSFTRFTSQRQLVYRENRKEFVVNRSSEGFSFDSPLILGSSVYYIASIGGERRLARTEIDGSLTQFLDAPSLGHPRFLAESPGGLSFAYAQDAKSHYKIALIRRGELLIFTNNVRGDMLRSVFEGSTLYFQGSLGESDNISQLPVADPQKNLPLAFRPLVLEDPPPPREPLKDTRYRQAGDLAPRFWLPFASFTEAGIQTVLFDPVGADTVSLGLGIDYVKATPQFSLRWVHASLPVHLILSVQNRYLDDAAVPNHGVSAAYDIFLPLSTPLNGSGSFSVGLQWIGRFVGPADAHPYQWTRLALQQLIVQAGFLWEKRVSEGQPLFERLARLQARAAVDTLNPGLWRAEVGLNFSPPAVPLFLNVYAAYDRGGALPSGSSFLGASLIPRYQEYANLRVPSRWAVFTSADLLLIPGEINRGLDMGEIFLHSINLFGGYRGGWWQAQGYLQSVYLRLDINLSVFYGKLKLGFGQEAAYAIERNNFSYSFSINTSLPF